jgi:hypothetical protein
MRLHKHSRAGRLISDPMLRYSGVMHRTSARATFFANATFRRRKEMERDDSMDRALDAALEMTFPASDPIAVYAYDPRSDAEAGREEAVD